MSGYFILAILALAFVVTFQIAKASEYVSVLKGEEKAFRQNNRINAFIFIAFFFTLLVLLHPQQIVNNSSPNAGTMEIQSLTLQIIIIIIIIKV